MQVLAQERESLTAILAELKPFEMHAATLSPAPMQLPKKAAEQVCLPATRRAFPWRLHVLEAAQALPAHWRTGRANGHAPCICKHACTFRALHMGLSRTGQLRLASSSLLLPRGESFLGSRARLNML